MIRLLLTRNEASDGVAYFDRDRRSGGHMPALIYQPIGHNPGSRSAKRRRAPLQYRLEDHCSVLVQQAIKKVDQLVGWILRRWRHNPSCGEIGDWLYRWIHPRAINNPLSIEQVIRRRGRQAGGCETEFFCLRFYCCVVLLE